jgi:DNA-binding CsgD family transcriptional regulator/PAS domain-containing protein
LLSPTAAVCGYHLVGESFEEGQVSGAEQGSDRLVAAVEAIYAAAPDPALWPSALQAIADVFGDIGAILIWQRDDGGFGTIVSPSLAEAQRDYAENGWYLRDLPAQRAVERVLWLRGDAATDRDAVSDEEMEKHPIYTDFFARHDLRWRAIVGVAPDPHISVFVAIQRSGRKQPYSNAELALASRLGRHVEKSLRLSVRLLDAEMQNRGLGDALNRLGIGVFALDALGRVVFANPAAERLTGEQIEIVDGRLVLGSPGQRASIRSALDHMLRDGDDWFGHDTKPILLRRPPPERPLAVYLLPLAPAASTAERFLAHTRCIALIVEPKANAPADPAVVRDLLGVTLGEARLAALVGFGLAPADAAERLGISEETARTVLKRVYAKSGVSRQSELANLLARLVVAPR